MTNNTQASQQVPSAMTVLTDEQIDKICAGFSTWMFPVETQKRDCERAIARAIERAVLAAATPGQEAVQAKLSIGATMANVMFNLAQGRTFTSMDRALCDDLRKQWDAANASVSEQKGEV